MMKFDGPQVTSSVATRNERRWGAIAALLALAAVAAGCSDTFKQFRDRAQPGIQSGVTSVLNGVLDGLFAVGDTSSSSNTNTNGG